MNHRRDETTRDVVDLHRDRGPADVSPAVEAVDVRIRIR
jgi:hypothetical protein